MERYSNLQALPNSPLTPLTPLSENTKFEFNFGGDGSLDKYIDIVRQEHRVEKQRTKLLRHASQSFDKKFFSLQPKRYTEEFLKIRDVFETHEQVPGQNQIKQCNCRYTKQGDTNRATNLKAPVVKITYDGASTTPTRSLDRAATPTNLRTPLKAINNKAPQNLNSNAHLKQKITKQQQQQIQIQNGHHLQINKNRVFRQASPVSAKPMCSRLANILHHSGLSMFCGLFQREEIDLYAFHLLTLQDLHQMGITNQNHCTILMHEIVCVRQQFKTVLGE